MVKKNDPVLEKSVLVEEVPIPVFHISVPALKKAVVVQVNEPVLVVSVPVEEVPIPVFEVSFPALEKAMVVDEPVAILHKA